MRESLLFKAAYKTFVKFVDREAIIKFVDNLKEESAETHEAFKILIKYAKEKKVSVEEEKFFREQFIDVIKSLGIGIPFAIIPGSALLLPLVLKIAEKYKIDILPSSFKKK
jgi:hypothetical protein